MKLIDVAVAVIHYKNKYLLGFRDENQHQGNRYEFVGGKIEKYETPKEALVREVYEEIGLDISQDSKINRLGILRHLYRDDDNADKSKKVCLHVYRVTVSASQYTQFKSLEQGCEGQSLSWADERDLIAGHYVLPEANKTILQWLSLPSIIGITFDIQKNDNDPISSWINFHSTHLAQDSCVYFRIKDTSVNEQEQILKQLISLRPDLRVIISTELADYLHAAQRLPSQVIAQHLTQSVLNALNTAKLDGCVPLPLTTSCHSQECMVKVNELSEYLLNQGRDNQQAYPLIGVFVSPVKSTVTHPDTKPLGWPAFKNLASYSEVPVIGLGGLSPKDITVAREFGADKVAGIRQFMSHNG